MAAEVKITRKITKIENGVEKTETSEETLKYQVEGENVLKIDWTVQEHDGPAVTINKRQTCNFVLKRIDYDKAVYSPGKVLLTFTHNGDYDGVIVRETLNSYLNSPVDLTIDANIIAHNYNIYSYQMKVGMNKKKIVRKLFVTCYSPDYKQTLHPSSNAWTGKKFGADILSAGFGCELTDVDRFSFLGNCVSKDTKKTDETDKDGNPIYTKIKAEAKQPYLVQYNESFYDFACRTANRCGEFLFYEDGQMNLGLTKNVLDSLTRTVKKNVLTEDKNADGTPKYANFPKLKVMIEDSCTFSECADITDIHSVNGLSDALKTDEGGVYDYGVADDAFLEAAVPNEDMKPLDIWGWWMAFTVFSEALKGESWDEVLSNAIESAGELTSLERISNLFSESAYSDDYIDGDDSKSWSDSKYVKSLGIDDVYEVEPTKEDETEEQKKKKPYINFVNAFYHQIENLEKQVTEQKVNLDFQDAMHSQKLGDNVYLEEFGEIFHIITRMHGYLSCESGEEETSHKAEAVPVINVAAILEKFKYKLDGGTADQTHKLFMPIPPLDSRPHIRHSDPQEAVVFDAADPLFNGRVRVRFPWQGKAKQVKVIENGQETNKDDATSNATPWIRVSTPFSGKEGNGGFYMTPEKESHVMVNFMHGNVEMPYVQSALFTSDDQPGRGWIDSNKRYMLPDYALRTIGSANGHSISFVDNKGIMGFLSGMIPAIPTLLKTFKDYLPWGITKEWEKNYGGTGGSMIFRDDLGSYEMTMSTEGRSITINSAIGKVEINAFTGITISAPNGDINITGKNINLKAGNNITIQSGQNVHDKEHSGQDIASTFLGIVSSLGIEAAKSATKQACGLDLSKLCDVKFIRAATEVILRPVEGSLKIMSNRNVIMTAGKGKVTLPTSNMSKTKKPTLTANGSIKPWKWSLGSTTFNETGKAKGGEVYKKYFTLADAINSISTKYNECSRNIPTATVSIIELRERLKTTRIKDLCNAVPEKKFVNKIVDFVDSEDDKIVEKIANLIKEIKLNDDKTAFVLPEYTDIYPNYETSNDPAVQVIVTNIVDVHLRSILDGSVTYVKAVSCSDTLTTDISKSNISDILQNLYDGKKNDLLKDVSFKEIADIDSLPVQDVLFEIQKAILDANLSELGFQYDNAKTTWQDVVGSIEKEKDSIGDKAWSLLKDSGFDLFNGVTGLDIDSDSYSNSWGKLFNWNGQAGPRSVWESGQNGGIFMSNNSGVTYVMDKKGRSWFPVANPNIEQLKALLRDYNTNSARRENLENFFYSGDVDKDNIRLADDDNALF